MPTTRLFVRFRSHHERDRGFVHHPIPRIACSTLLLLVLLSSVTSATVIDEDFKNVEVTAAIGQVALTSLSMYQVGNGESGRFPALLGTALGIASLSIAATDDAHFRAMDIVVGTVSLGVGVWTLFNRPGRTSVRADLQIVPTSSLSGANWSPAIVFTLRR